MEIVEQQTNKRGGKFTAKMKNFFTKAVSSRGRKIALLTGLLALLVVTGYLNFTLNQNAADVNAGVRTETNLFTTFQDSRANMQTARKLLLTDIISNTSASAAARADAEAQLNALSLQMAFENKTENLIRMNLGLQDVVVSKSVNASGGTNMNVIVRKEAGAQLSTEQVVQIMTIMANALDQDRLEPENGDSLFITQM